ncbi:disease resistance protein TAO1-like [Neltuma alba]|uniref:disease resistance protein TAO1-like n=1 Tax=Neltuma alba TaxID=207710 RepID=UPI0010A4FA90|nr:disease resistance protein TAO1-like [Prosopis alba]
MGREIIREQSPEKPEKRNRLWLYNDVLEGTISIKGLALNISRNNSLYLNARTFKKMKRLRLLQLDNVQLTGDYSHLSTNLRWLCWHGFPLESLPVNFNLENIIAIDLKWSNLVKVWEKSQGWNDGRLDFSLPIDNYPDWLVFVNELSSVSFKVPHLVGHRLKGVVLNIIYSSLQDSMASVPSVGIMIKNFTKATMYFYERKVATTSTDDEWQNIVSNLEPGNEVEVEIKFAYKYIVIKKTTIYLLYVQEANKLITSE